MVAGVGNPSKKIQEFLRKNFQSPDFPYKYQIAKT